MIALLTNDETLERMLELELIRGGFSRAKPEEASVWLLDLDHPPAALPNGAGAAVIGFSEGAPTSGRGAPSFPILPVPYPTERLQELLHGLAHRDREAGEQMYTVSGYLICGSRRIALSASEEKMMTLLLRDRGRVVTAQALLDALGNECGGSNVLQVLIYRLRRKLAFDGKSRIRSVRGVGYLLTAES